MGRPQCITSGGFHLDESGVLPHTNDVKQAMTAGRPHDTRILGTHHLHDLVFQSPAFDIVSSSHNPIIQSLTGSDRGGYDEIYSAAIQGDWDRAYSKALPIFPKAHWVPCQMA